MNILKKYIWLIDTLIRSGNRGLTFEEISEKYSNSDHISEGGSYALRTFHDHRKAIGDIFGIDIVCNHSENRYSIADIDDLKSPGYFRQWMLETVSINNLVSANDKLRDRILLEKIPSVSPALAPLLTAMQEGHTVNFTYVPFDKEQTPQYHDFQPWTLKMSRRRWYVYGLTSEKGMRIFSLDRITDVETTGNTFVVPDDFDAELLFHNTFGAFVSTQEQPQLIKIKVDDEQAKYLRSLPMHHSQKEIESTPQYSVFTLFVTPSYDLKQELLTMNAHAEILAPESLRNEMKELLHSMLGKYE